MWSLSSIKLHPDGPRLEANEILMACDMADVWPEDFSTRNWLVDVRDRMATRLHEKIDFDEVNEHMGEVANLASEVGIHRAIQIYADLELYMYEWDDVDPLEGRVGSVRERFAMALHEVALNICNAVVCDYLGVLD